MRLYKIPVQVFVQKCDCLDTLQTFDGQVSGELIQASAGEDVRFPLSEDCRKGHGALYLHLKDGSTQIVASLAGNWKPGRAHTDRVIVSSDALILKNVDLNDQGLYEFTCEKKNTELTDLQVFVPSEVVVSEGEDATLSCRSITLGQSVKSARWRRNGELLLELNGRTREITYGRGFNESRVSVPSGWYQRANLSLTLKRAEVKDQGAYYCDIDKAEKHRSAVRLIVRVIVPKSVTTLQQPTPAPLSPECPYWTWTTFLITAAGFVIVGLLAWLIWNKMFKGSTRGAGGETSQREEGMNLRGVSNGGGLLSNSQRGGRGCRGQRTERDQQQMFMLNGFH
ncbi:uncharacterized protein LOC115797010 [Archocentrus centrarchus]|uniref:uncharacterized protein LOC115797010 n=1 Tax=Archocentrus centrarchus TaxID=63155 RepID=UPI0011E9C90A|nr:uncharacterized protein LOC115797010 [Archocentrus centrarchus]